MPTTEFERGPRPTGHYVLSDVPLGTPDAPWLESQRRSRSRRLEAGRRLRRLRGRRSLAVMALLSLTIAAGGATAASDRQAAKVVRTSGSSVAAVQQALGIPADGIAGPQTLAALGLAARGSSAPATDAAAVLAKIAQCESGGDPTTDTGNGYYGKYQFSRATWRRMGGRGNPARASEAEQDQRAAMLYEQEGTAPWPVCGRGL